MTLGHVHGGQNILQQDPMAPSAGTGDDHVVGSVIRSWDDWSDLVPKT